MHNLAEKLDAPSADPGSLRHRTARAESFPSASADVDYDAREAAYLRSLLDPLRELARTSADAGARAIAEAALADADAGDAPLDDHARLEDALEQIATTTTDPLARAAAEDALALYRGR
ncbi:MAG: hypothetical protein ACLQVI_03295 [Polyangiaceae bacterium]